MGHEQIHTTESVDALDSKKNGESLESPFLNRVHEKIADIKNRFKQRFTGSEIDINRATGEFLTDMAEQTITESGSGSAEAVEAVVSAEVETVDDKLDDNRTKNPIVKLVNDDHLKDAADGVIALAEAGDVSIAEAVAKDIDYAERHEYKEHEPEPSAKYLAESLSLLFEKQQIGKAFPQETIIGDADHIKNQQYNIIRLPDGSAKMYFRLSADTYDEVSAKIANGDITTRGKQDMLCGEVPVGKGNVIDLGADGVQMTISSSRADRLQAGLSDADVLKYAGWSEKLQRTIEAPDLPDTKKGYESMLFRTLDGQVVIDLPVGVPLESVASLLDSALHDQLGVESAFAPPSPEAIAQHETALYNWHHKLSADNQEIPMDDLHYEEVFDGYSTIVETGKADEYETKYGKFAFFHQLASLDQIASILRGGISCTTGRFERGITAHGKGSIADLKYGGADAAFTRMIAGGNLQDDELWPSEAFLVLSPKLAERTDWHTHDFNAYGRADEDNMSKRLSPDELLNNMSTTGFQTMDYNEQLFQSGISPEMICAVMVSDEEHRDKALSALRSAGITEFYGKGIEEVIVIANRRQDIINLSHPE